MRLVALVEYWRRQACDPHAECGDHDCLTFVKCAEDLEQAILLQESLPPA